MMELAYMMVSKTIAERHVGSNPTGGTMAQRAISDIAHELELLVDEVDDDGLRHELQEVVKELKQKARDVSADISY